MSPLIFMQVLAYPVTYSGDFSKLPIVKSKAGANMLAVQFGEHVDEELVNAFILATRRGCQWLELRTDTIVRDEMTWRDI